MLMQKERNLGFMPSISTEGFFIKCMPPVPKSVSAEQHWFSDLPVGARLHYHQTLNSARRFACFQPYE
jgi:hypothetical protein